VYRFYATDLGKRMVQSGDFRNPYTGQQFDDVELMRLTHMLRRHEAFRYNLVTQKPSLIRAAQIRGEEARMGDFFEERFNAFVDQVVEMEARCEEGVRVIAMILAINNSFPELADVIHAFGALDADRQARVVQAGLERLQQVITNSQQHLFRSIAQNVVCTILRILHPVRCERFHMQFFAENIMAAHESRPLMFVPSVQILGNLRGTTAMGVHISAAISAVADAHLNAMLLNNVVV
jgi:hypothetical protein